MASTADKTSTVLLIEDGRIDLPADLLEALGIRETDLLRAVVADGELRITPVRNTESSDGSTWLRELYDYYAPVREEILARGISEEEVNAVIDEAIAEVRAEQRAKRK